MTFQPSYATPSDVNLLPEALGAVAWTQDPRFGGLVGHQATSGILHGNAVWIPQGKTITRLEVFIATAGIGVTDAWVAIYDKSLALLAQSNDTPAFANVLGWQGANLQAPWTCPRSDFYYFADLYIGGTMPFYTDSGTVAAAALSQTPNAGLPFLWFQQVGLAALPNPCVPAQSQVPHMMVAR